MECNRDEAFRAKEIAEKKFSAKDITGAKRFALKAQNLFPGLEGISQMLATLDVYISAESKINGEADWYGILGVNPKADDETVRKHYRKLALTLHPDKNKSMGADGAFKLISEAWSLLSDKAKRLAYDQKRNFRATSQQKVQPSNGGGPSVPPPPNGFYNFTKCSNSRMNMPKSNATKAGPPPPAAPPPKKENHTFWTACHRCRMHYEYLRMYLNHNLLCPNCHEPFFAEETPPPPLAGSKAARDWDTFQKQRNLNHYAEGKNKPNDSSNSNNANFHWGPFSKPTGAASTVQAATMVQQAYEKVKRQREEAQAAIKREEALKRKNQASKRASGVSSSKRKKGNEDLSASSSGRDGADPKDNGSGVAKKANVSGPSTSSTPKDAPTVDIKLVLMEMAKKEIHKKLNEWRLDTAARAAIKGEETVNKKEIEKEKETENSVVHSGDQDQDKPTRASSPFKEPIDQISINVPDPDFHDFDRDRSEKCFGENQVWAAYDDDDGMPRYYAIIHDVISFNPFKMRISWLNSKTNTELGPINWVASGFTKTCGDFRIGKHEINLSLNSFSHKIRWTKGSRGTIQIFPKKGDVWALYRDWSPEWNELTADDVIHKYDMVEVLEDYDEEEHGGVVVTPLVKVAGFKTLFHRHLDPREEKTIPKEEMFRFSHSVPSYVHNGQEAPDAPKGCRELDPAATPLELIRVIGDVQEAKLESEGNKAEIIV